MSIQVCCKDLVDIYKALDIALGNTEELINSQRLDIESFGDTKRRKHVMKMYQDECIEINRLMVLINAQGVIKG